MANAFYTHGNGSSIEFREALISKLMVAPSNVFKTDFDHNAKTGFEQDLSNCTGTLIHIWDGSVL